jgi:rod shape-determining protein MreD
MPVVRFVAGLLLAAALQAAGARLVPGLPQWIDLFLVATVVAARHGHPEGGLFAGLAAGWAADALSGGPFGLFGFANAAVGYGAATAARNLVVARPGSIAALFALAAAAQAILVLLLALLGVAGPSLPAPLPLLVKVASSAILGLVWVRLQGWVAGRFGRRRGRPSGAHEVPKSW